MNLTEVVVRENDSFDTLKKKIRVATILGTIQSTLTDFQFLSPEWKRNCEEERLLGVSMTGIMDCPILNGSCKDFMTTETILTNLRECCKEVNKDYAEKLGINVSVARTCVKPSGTVAQLTGAGTGGIHPRYAPYYIRSIRQDNKDPLTDFLKQKDIPWEPAFGKEDNTTVFYFPIKSPKNAVFRDDRTAIQQLEHWLLFQRYWCDHKPSVTIYVKEHEWLEVGAWVYKHFDEMSGVSFLPHSDHSYQQAPFAECSEEKYLQLLSSMPSELNWDELMENDDQTTASQELACIGGICIV